MRKILLALALLVACSKPAPAPAPPPPAPAAQPVVTRVAPADLGTGPEAALVTSRCTTCHTNQVPLQQRLTEAQWKKTLAKMKGWGAAIDDEESARLAAYLGHVLGPDVPDLEPVLVPVPAGGS